MIRSMRVATWNIRAGGGKRLKSITDRLLAERCDLCVLTEFRSKPGEYLTEQLIGHHFCVTQPPVNQNGVLAFGRDPLVTLNTNRRSLPISSHRWLCCHHSAAEVIVLGVHIPNQNERWNKDDFWTRLCRFAKKNRAAKAMILGDFNTGLDADTENEKFLHSPQFQSLLDMGWVDCFRAVHGDRREYSWYSPNAGNGYRLDHCFLSPLLAPRLADARFDHDVRTSGLSDHSMLTVELAD